MSASFFLISSPINQNSSIISIHVKYELFLKHRNPWNLWDRQLQTLIIPIFQPIRFLFQIRRIKDDVEYYIESSQEPDFEENEYIYDDIIGLDEVELSGVLASSATTDSNGTPTSLTSSPAPSPPLPLHNHSSESSTDEKKKKEPVDGVKVIPDIVNMTFSTFSVVD